jgi:hypothetical protein
MKMKLFFGGAALLAGFGCGAFSSWIGSKVGNDQHAVVTNNARNDRRAFVTNERNDVAFGNALAELRAGDNDLTGLVRLGRALAQLDSTQIGTLLDRLEHDDWRSSDKQLSWLFTWWRKRDPAAARAWIEPRLIAAAQDGPLGFTFDFFARGQVILVWAKSDPKAALEFARLHPRTGLATKLLHAAMAEWREKDYRTKIALLLEFPAGHARDTVLAETHRGWAFREPANAFASAESMPPGPEREKAIWDVLTAWSEKDAAAALDKFDKLSLTDARLLSTMLAKYADKAPADAAALLTRLDASLLARCGPKVVEAWAQHDPASALSWALANGVRLSWVFETSSHLEHNGFSRTSSGSFQTINPLAKAFEKQPEATLAWLRTLPPGAERDRVTELAVNSCRDVDQALALFATLPAENAARTAGGIVAKFGGDAARAHQWVTALPPGPARLAGWAGLGALPNAKFDIPVGPDRDAYLTGTLHRSGLVPKPEERLATIAEVSDSVLRHDLFDEVMEEHDGGWQSDDAEAALANAPFPDEWKQRWRAAP